VVCLGEVHAQQGGDELIATMLATMIAQEGTGLSDYAPRGPGRLRGVGQRRRAFFEQLAFPIRRRP
jgi:hypothetical protein